jgi:hypothetical protein
MAKPLDATSPPTEEPKPTPDQLAAHDLLSELRTRIATQPLPYQHGVEAEALKSLWQLFELTRTAMKAHPGCRDFARTATKMLNTVLRPVTAKWHRAYEAGILDSRDGANDFRTELRDVRIKLMAFAQELQQMAYGQAEADDETPPVLSKDEIDECFEPLRHGLDEGPTNADRAELIKDINDGERQELLRRRKLYGVAPLDEKCSLNAVGLALSGGGIRSATFCLGVIQVLAARKLMPQFDYLSTVSGGGYTGSLISSLIGTGADFSAMAAPFGPDTDPIRHVRRNAKYLSVVDLKQRWFLILGALAGLLLNWTAPLFVLSLAALIASASPADATGKFLMTALPFAFTVAGLTTGLFVLLYGCSLRLAPNWIQKARIILGVGGAITAFFGLCWLVEYGFQHFRHLQQSGWAISGGLAFAVIASPAIARFLPIFRSDFFRKAALVAALNAAGVVVPLLAIATFYLLRWFGGINVYSVSGWWSLLFFTAITGSFAVFFLNINLTSPHKLYRDQLANTFVWKSGGAEQISLSSLNPDGGAPYHLINAAVNLPSSKSEVLRDRKTDFFLISKLWTGSQAVGYAPTSNWLTPEAPLDLATAMAISGAAASPHMGLATRPTLSALMTLLNLRLGFWIPKPGSVSPGVPGFLCLMREMMGIGMSETDTWLNVSDGGHIENMGMYELLRRRCKFIVCVDGEADPQSTFGGQLTLVRHAQIDLGVRIEPRLDDIRPDPKSRFSRAHAQLFRIFYPAGKDGKPEGTGLMLYLKLSLTGDEAELLKRYRNLNPEFPHQSTIDQFYDEEQFEVYRQLGVHVAEGAFSPALMTKGQPADIADWFKQLAANLLEPVRKAR